MRRALVLGAGGVLGAAWETGALCRLADEGLDRWDLVVGTSAGSVLAALLAAGIPPQALRDHQRGLPLPGDVAVDWDHDRGTGGPRPVRPALRPGSPSLVAAGLRRPRAQRPLVTLVGLAPRGRGSHAALAAAVEAALGGAAWAPRPVWVCALDYRTGRRVVFGREGAPRARLSEAVAASCSLPGWYAPTVLDGVPYVDGGSLSSTSVGLLAGAGYDEVVVLAPTATAPPSRYDRPRGLEARLERRWRRHVTPFLLREVAAVEAGGTRVRVETPDAADLEAVGGNLMDPRRRLRVLDTALRPRRR
ncbi:patatin-like phospholipase family protein [Vallicoccus soli]|uniref:Patatin-like phospholipase family protein n=1 Tax=Vallicoccus soli TaxID=2339232 RepID=A0A3A3YXI3_9ACTN|nr:patatin-like phospholipase family protein [Vallicoccus soli]RJK95423.1 patatin-like phospholipase family protein [Vallicoccus soli]